MGCCESCLGKESDEPSERSPLLRPAGGVAADNSTDPVSTPYDYHDATPVGSVVRSKDNEQSILSGIISQYNNEVIDITSLDSKIDAVEYMNRVQLYNRKVATLTSGKKYKQPALYSASSNPSAILNNPPVNIDDVILITEFSGDMRIAMNSVKVEKQKELVLSLAHR